MVRVFADTVYWIALLNSRDALHKRAFELAATYPPQQIATSEMVLTEMLNAVCGHGHPLRPIAVKYVASLRELSDVWIYPQTSQLFASAFHRYQQRPDKGWSLTDCASFVIMEEQRLTSALTYDQHFLQAGFQALLR
jgi:uncharacterized protein